MGTTWDGEQAAWGAGEQAARGAGEQAARGAGGTQPASRGYYGVIQVMILAGGLGLLQCPSHYVSLPSLIPWGKACRLSGDVEPESSWFSHHQGNIEFIETEEGHLFVAEDRLVDYVAELTATPRELVLRCLLARTVASGGREVIQKGHTAAEASYARDACAKVLQGQAMWGGPVSRSSWRRQGRGRQKQPGLSPGSVPAAL